MLSWECLWAQQVHLSEHNHSDSQESTPKRKETLVGAVLEQVPKPPEHLSTPYQARAVAHPPAHRERLCSPGLQIETPCLNVQKSHCLVFHQKVSSGTCAECFGIFRHAGNQDLENQTSAACGLRARLGGARLGETWLRCLDLVF